MTRAIRKCISLSALLLGTVAAEADLTWEFSVQVSAQATASPPGISLSWPQDVAAIPTNYLVWRKNRQATDWGEPQILPGSSTNVVDMEVQIGMAYEYQLLKQTSNHIGYGYICAGVNLPPTENRGTIILLVEQSCGVNLGAELARLTQDLVGDGWTVLRHDVPREGDVTDIKALIKADYDSDPANVKTMFLFGRVPVPYSGDITPDGHPTEHMGAWPADVYYGQLDGVWTDLTVSNTTASNARNWNVPGDGKFDQSEIPGTVQLQVGRVDFANMPGFDTNGVPTFPSETELLRRYLDKDHAYRQKLLQIPERGIVFNETGDRNGEAFAVDGWRNYGPLLGPPPAPPLNHDTFLPILHTNAYLWAYATAGASMRQMSGLGGTGDWGGGGTTVDFVNMDAKAVFGMLFGSWLGDWDGGDNLMRAILATPTCGLACFYAGRPHWFLHYMGIGETLGYSLRLTQNNHADGLYQNQSNAYPGFVHIALLGDPTLRLYPVAPPSGLVAASISVGTQLSWGPSADPVAGYYVYRSTDPGGPFTRLTPFIWEGTIYVDFSILSGPVTYMVRAVNLENRSSGSWFNLSQGAFVTAIWQPVALTLPTTPNTVVFTWVSTPGATYRVYYKDNLENPSWAPLTSNIVATAFTTSLTDSSRGGGPMRFYRVEEISP